MGGVEAGEALDLVPEAAVLVPCLQQLPPHRMEALVVVLKQAAVPVPHLHFFSSQWGLPVSRCTRMYAKQRHFASLSLAANQHQSAVQPDPAHCGCMMVRNHRQSLRRLT